MGKITQSRQEEISESVILQGKNLKIFEVFICLREPQTDRNEKPFQKLKLRKGFNIYIFLKDYSVSKYAFQPSFL